MLRNLAVKMFSRASTTRVEDGIFHKQYPAEPFLAAWGLLEGRSQSTPRKRMQREWERLNCLYAASVNVPEPVGVDYERLTLKTRYIPSVSVRAYLSDTTVSTSQKFDAVAGALDTLKAMHDAGVTHGDPYLKNFVRAFDGTVYGCDLEHERNGIDERVNDLRLFAADAIFNCAPQGLPAREILGLVQSVSEGLPRLDFSVREDLFYRVRFGVSDAFFDQL